METPCLKYELKETGCEFVISGITRKYDNYGSRIVFICMTNVETGLESIVEELIFFNTFVKVEDKK